MHEPISDASSSPAFVGDAGDVSLPLPIPSKPVNGTISTMASGHALIDHTQKRFVLINAAASADRK